MKWWKFFISASFIFLFIFSYSGCSLPQQDVESVTLSGAYATDISADQVKFKISVTPLDKDGNFISEGVTEDNFSFKNVKVYQIEDPADEGEFYTSADVKVTSLTIKEVTEKTRLVGAIVIDSSGSMEDNDPDRVRVTAAKKFVSHIRSGDKLCVYDFGSGEADVRLLQDFTDSKEDLLDAIDQVEATDGTPLYAALVQAAEHLEEFKEDEGRSGDRYFIIVLTDGSSTDDYYSLDDAISAAKNVPAPVYAIGLGSDVNVDDLTTLALETGGWYLQAEDADQLTSFFDAQGVATSKGYVVVNGEGTFNDPLEEGLYRIKGELVTSIGEGEVTTPFDFVFDYEE